MLNKKAMGGAGIALISIGLVVLFLVFWIAGSYNGLVSSDETVNEKWGYVQSAYQRRADLVPNLVEVVKGYAAHESDVFTAVTEARSRVGSANTPAELQEAGTSLDSAISRLLLVVENYPELKANENFLSLQDELAGTENRIKVERDNFNTAVKQMNIKVRRFPTNIIAGMFGFETREMFESDEGSETAPRVTFE